MTVGYVDLSGMQWDDGVMKEELTPILIPVDVQLTSEEEAARLEQKVAELRDTYEPKCGWLIDTKAEKSDV